MKKKATPLILAIGLSSILALTGCSNDSSNNSTPSENGTHNGHSQDSNMLMPAGSGDPFMDARTAAEHMPMTAETLATGLTAGVGIEGDASSDAATMRSQLTHLLNEHVYLAGIGVATAYKAGPDSAEFQAAADALDANSVELSELIGSVATPEQEEAFLSLWREHIGYFVDYAVSAQAGDEQGKMDAMNNLNAYTDQAGMFFEEISDGQLPASAISEGLKGHVSTLTAAIDAMAAGDPTAAMKLKEAAMHVTMAAKTMAAGLSSAAGVEGDSDDAASELRSQLTYNLGEHVYLASYAVFNAYTDEIGADSEAFKQAAAALDNNSVELSEMVGSISTPEQQEAFLALWRDHIGYFVDYALAAASDDEDGKTMALNDLNQYRTTAGDFFEEVSNGELKSADVAEGLKMHVESLAGAIDSLKETLVS